MSVKLVENLVDLPDTYQKDPIAECFYIPLISRSKILKNANYTFTDGRLTYYLDKDHNFIGKNQNENENQNQNQM